MSSDPRYSYGQVQQVLRHAAKLQGEARALDRREASIAEIEDMAAEASIDRALVRQGARELTHRSAPVQPHGALGITSRITLQRTIDGELPDVARERLAGGGLGAVLPITLVSLGAIYLPLTLVGRAKEAFARRPAPPPGEST